MVRPYVFGFREVNEGGVWVVEDYVRPNISSDLFLSPLEEKLPGLAKRIESKGPSGIEVREHYDSLSEKKVVFIDGDKVLGEYTPD